MKKNIFFFFALLLLVVTASAQKISYQAVIRDSQNRLVTNSPVSLSVTITHSEGTYTESLNSTTNANGLMSLEIGGASGFDAIDWRNATIRTVVTLEGGETVENVAAVTAAPLALYANYAADVNPSAPTILAIYTHIKDTLSHYPTLEVLKDSTTAIRGALIDTASAIRGSMNTQVNQLQANIDTTSSHIRGVLIDTAAAIRGSMSTQVNQLQANIDTTSSHIRGALIDTAAAIRGSMSTQVNQLQANIDTTSSHIRGALIDTAAAIRGNMNTQVNQLQANIDTTSSHIRGALIDTAAAIRGNMNTQVNQLQANIDTTSSHIRGALIDTASAIRTTVNMKANAADVYTKTETYTKAEVDALLAQMQNLIDNMPKMGQEHFVVAADQTTTETVFTLARTTKTDCIYRIYVNGVMVGGSNNGALLPVANEENKVKYDGTKNGDYKLKADDKVTIVYWY